jgi:hypothetical protein
MKLNEAILIFIDKSICNYLELTIKVIVINLQKLEHRTFDILYIF